MHLITHLLTSSEVAERQAGTLEQNGSIFMSSCSWKPGAPARSQPHWASWNHHPVPRSWNRTAEENPVWTHGPLRGRERSWRAGSPSFHAQQGIAQSLAQHHDPARPACPGHQQPNPHRITMRCMTLCPQMEILAAWLLGQWLSDLILWV